MSDDRERVRLAIDGAVGGAYEMPDGRSFWIDGATAREITRRVQAALAAMPERDPKVLVDRFLTWPLPKSVRSDLCVTMDYPHVRTGTNLLTADEARQMLEYLFALPPLPEGGGEEACPGHVASERDPKVCGICGVHINSLREEPPHAD